MSGLSSAQAEALLEEVGRNEIPEVVKPWWKMLGEQFIGVMPFMIEIAMILAAALGDWDDFGIILAMLVINAALGFREEFNSNRAAGALKDALKHEVSVKRDGEMRMLEVELPVVPPHMCLPPDFSRAPDLFFCADSYGPAGTLTIARKSRPATGLFSL